MRILVTVGTTAFQSLIDYISTLTIENCEFVVQYGPSAMSCDTHESFDYSNSIDKHYQMADLIISHAGAGSTFKLLALQKPIILVPNLERVDKHQTDLAKYMEDNNHVFVAWALENIPLLIKRFQNKEYSLAPFEPKRFFAQEKLMKLLLD